MKMCLIQVFTGYDAYEIAILNNGQSRMTVANHELISLIHLKIRIYGHYGACHNAGHRQKGLDISG